MASLIDNIGTPKNPVSFVLPESIRDYFEGVKTGDDNEYETVNNGHLVERPR